MIPPPGPGQRGPSVTLPLRYLVAAAGAFVLASLAVPWLARELAGHYYHPRLLALTHTVALGWITLAVMGASYQLIPIVLERPLWSERLARWQFVALVTGVVGLVGHFFRPGELGLLAAVALIGLGVAAHLVNVLLTVRGLARWTFTARLIAGAHVALGLTLCFGAALAVGRAGGGWPGNLFAALHAHFHLALLGWMAPMVIGVAARVYPMFLLAAEPEGWPGRVQLAGLGLGLPLVVGGLLGWAALVAPGALAIAAALAAHVVWIARMVRDRRRPALDWGLTLVLIGAAFLVPGTGIGLALALDLVAGPRPALAYAVLALGGWLSLTIVGMMWKIVPFLVWYRVYGPRVGRARVPTLPELSWRTGEALAAGLLTAGALALAVAIAAGTPGWIRGAGLLFAAGACLFAVTLGRVLAHLLASPDGPPVPSAASGQAR